MAEQRSQETNERHASNGAGATLCCKGGRYHLALPGETVNCKDCLRAIAHVRTAFNLDGSVKARQP